MGSKRDRQEADLASSSPGAEISKSTLPPLLGPEQAKGMTSSTVWSSRITLRKQIEGEQPKSVTA